VRVYSKVSVVTSGPIISLKMPYGQYPFSLKNAAILTRMNKMVTAEAAFACLGVPEKGGCLSLVIGRIAVFESAARGRELSSFLSISII
tara:strand:- start:299 stop:565 length:267 start_codon:yes stop_codon:yes gene_type:complete